MGKLSRAQVATLTLCAALAAGGATAEEIANSRLLAQNCAACHGTDGREFHEAMPPLAGMDTESFVRAMQQFASGERPAIIMDRVANAYSEAEIRAMAEFFAGQPAIQYE